MKLLIFSDNHRDRESVKQALDKNPNLDHYISLGDSEMREIELSELGIYGVKGNYPFEPKFPDSLLMDYDGIRVFLTHGHLYGVKMGLTRLLNYAIHNDIQIVCFGHTHRSFLNIVEDVIFINPGSLSSRRLLNEASYCILSIEEKQIIAQIKNLDDKIILEVKKDR